MNAVNTLFFALTLSMSSACSAAESPVVAKLYWVNWNSTANIVTENDVRSDSARMEIILRDPVQIAAFVEWLELDGMKANANDDVDIRTFLVIDICESKDECRTYISDGRILTSRDGRMIRKVDKNFRDTISLFLANPFFE